MSAILASHDLGDPLKFRTCMCVVRVGVAVPMCQVPWCHSTSVCVCVCTSML